MVYGTFYFFKIVLCVQLVNLLHEKKKSSLKNMGFFNRYFSTVLSPPPPHHSYQFLKIPPMRGHSPLPCSQYLWGILLVFGALKQLYSSYLLRCIMYYLLRYHKDQTQVVGLFFEKRVLICGLNPKLIYLQRVFKNLYTGNRTLFP